MCIKFSEGRNCGGARIIIIIWAQRAGADEKGPNKKGKHSLGVCVSTQGERWIAQRGKRDKLIGCQRLPLRALASQIIHE